MESNRFQDPGGLFQVISLTVRNFRSFERFELKLHPRLTVLVAPNAGGKTAVLDALAVALGPFLSVFPDGQGPGVAASDVRLTPGGPGLLNMEPCYPVEVSSEGVLQHRRVRWQRSLRSAKGRTTHAEARDLLDYGRRIQERLRAGDRSVELPLVAYYGTGRLWQHGRIGRERRRAISPLAASRALGYRGCLQPSSNFREFALWFRQLSLAVFQRRMDRTAADSDRAVTENLERMLDWVHGALARVLAPSGWTGPFYDVASDSIVARHRNHGVLPVASLSDGVRNLLAMVADAAFRAAKLNPDLGPGGSHGIVLIDEVDMHLHPAWQQRVLLDLLDAFPRVQFVVTTHSPHVVSTVPRDCVRILGPERGSEPDRQTEGLDGDSALAEVFWGGSRAAGGGGGKTPALPRARRAGPGRLP